MGLISLGLLIGLGAASQAPVTEAVTVVVAPAHGAARAALLAGDGDAALAALDEAARRAAPGLVIRAERLRGRGDLACAVAVPDHGAGARHKLVCAATANDAAPAALALARVEETSPALLFVDDAAALALEVAVGAAPPTVVENVAKALLARPVAPFDAAARARDVRVIRALSAKLAASSPSKTALAERLAFELPELATAAELAAVGDPTAPGARVRRATTLERLHRSDEVVELLADLSASDCEAALLVGKSERKRKKYAAARAALRQAAAPRCSAEQRKRAEYLEARVASVQKGKGTEALLRAFVERYGNDSLSDDVLLWLSEVQAATGDEEAARATLLRIARDHADGDMADDARVRVALALARDEDAAAIGVLDDGVAVLLRSTTPRVAELDRARYWAARLRAAPNPDSWTPSADTAQRDAGVRALTALAEERPLSFYGHLAGLVAQSLGGQAPRALVIPAAATTVAVPTAVASQPTFVAAVSFGADGFDDEAAAMLADVVVDKFDVVGASAVGAVFASVGRPDLAHRAMRARGLALLPGAPSTSAEALSWSLSWPRAFEAPLTSAATAHGVPPHLMRGLAREESTFDASVVSWAGAVGLCQLMPATAKDEARSLKLPAPTVADLSAPALNATLGASHLGRRLKGLKHPFKGIAAYNAGPGAVLKWVPPAGTKRPVDAWVEAIPFDETRNYVKKVTGSWVTYAALEGGGLPSIPLSL